MPMLSPLYLDTARLGQMSPRACRAAVDFARFANEHGCSLYLSQLLHDGFHAWPATLQEQYAGLQPWDGLASLAENLKSIANAAPESELVVAARSAELMRFAAKLLIGPCRNVLLTDLSWPAYEQILANERRGAACICTRLEIRQAILRERIDSGEVVKRIADAFVRNRCDGLFLPLVDNLGVKLPIHSIVDRIRASSELRFTVVDGAQAIGHVPLELCAGYCDLLLAGCHKWLKAFSPLGLAFFGLPGSAGYIRDSLRRWLAKGDIDDPLLSFSQEFSAGHSTAFGETVNVSSLLTASGAAVDALQARSWLVRNEPHSKVIEVAREYGWNDLRLHDDLATKILLLQAQGNRAYKTAESIKSKFLARGIALTAYDAGLIRLSLPPSGLAPYELTRLAGGFSHAAACQV